MTSVLRFFLTWWGAALLAALDASMLFFVPLGIDAVVIYLAARNNETFWVYPLLATGGSAAGAAVTFWVGRKIGEVGLERWMSPRRLEHISRRVRDRGAIAMALPALLPPPFPLTLFILTCGALDMNRWRFFGTFAAVRLLRFGAEAALARAYGDRILVVLQSEGFKNVILVFVAIAVVGTAVSAIVLWRNSHESKRLRPA